MEDRVAKLVGKVPTAGLQPCLGWPQTRAVMGTAARELVFIRVPSLPVEQACHYSQLLGSSHLFFFFPSFLDKVSSLCNRVLAVLELRVKGLSTRLALNSETLLPRSLL